MMRTLHTQNWPQLLKDAVSQLNSRPLKKLNGLAPKDFNSPLDDVKLEQPGSSTSTGASDPKIKPDVSQQMANQKAYEANKKQLQVLDFVYIENKKKSFSKSFETKVCKYLLIVRFCHK
jgi:hypothetical protein